MKVPAVSVIIPLYNAEKYIGDCLDSILAQTFQNFEVIVVDDCSTDNSVKIVKSYESKFGGRLKISKTKKNSGGAGLPRNKGIEISRGEYLSFIDPDDAITPTAFEELYSLAKNFNVDVVHCEKHYYPTREEWQQPKLRKNLKPYNYLTKEHRVLSGPTFLIYDIEKRILEFNKRWILWSVCLQLIRREFIMKNKLRFGNFYSEDMLFTMCEICCAERYLLVPNVTYYYIKREDSATNKELQAEQYVKQYVGALVRGFEYLDKFFNCHAFFNQRIDLKYILFDFFAQGMFNRFGDIYKKSSAHSLDQFLRQEIPSGKNAALLAFIMNLAALYRLRIRRNQKYFKQAQARINELENEIRRLKNEE